MNMWMQEEGKTLIADEFKEVTILFTDLRGFTEFASHVEPKDLVVFLNVMYTQVGCTQAGCVLAACCVSVTVSSPCVLVWPV